jgi:ABC-2 type transport system permease protein
VDRTGEAERCESRWLTQPENLLYRDLLRPAQFEDWVLPMIGPTAAVALLVGATFIGADIASGSIGTQLLFQPSRWKVWTAKVGALVLGTALFSGASLAVSNAAIWIFARAWDRPTPPGLLTHYSASLGRGVVLTAAAGLVGFGLVLIARHTAAALGVLALYGIAAETVLRAVWPGSERWLVSNHVAAFIGGAFHRDLYVSCTASAPCRVDTLDFTMTFASAYLGLGLLVVAAASWLVFQRRDVP